MPKKPTKWQWLLDRLPRLPSEADPDRRALLDALKAEVNTPVEVNVAGGTRGTSDDPRKLRRMLDDVQSYVEQILSLQKSTTGGRRHAAEYARAYAELRQVEDRFDGWKRDLNLLIQAYEELMLDQLEAEGMSGLRMTNGQLLSCFPEPYATVKDREAFRLWCIGAGYERKLALPWSSLNALVKERLEAGDPQPDGVEIFVKTKVRLGAE